MKILSLIFTLLIIFHGLSYATWAWRDGNKGGGVGMACFSLFTLATVSYMLFVHQSY